jgi:PAS domain S-box-containing protein
MSVLHLNDDSAAIGWAGWRDAVLSVANVLLREMDGRIVLWSDGAARLYGWPAAHAIGTCSHQLLQTRFFPETQDEINAKLYRDGRWQGELHHRRQDGTPLMVVSQWVLVRDGDTPMVIEVNQDISDLAEARQAQAKLAAIVASSDDAIIGKTLDGVVTSWNAAAERILGWPAADMIGQPITAIVPPVGLAEEAGILARIRAGQRVEHFETVRMRRDGSLVPVSLTVSPIHDRHGVIVGASKILRDTTERKRAEAALRQANEMLEYRVAERTRELAEQAEARRKAEAALAQSQRLEAVGQLTGGVAHDFNNLLTVIAGNLHFIAESATGNDRLQRLVTSSHRAVERGARLTGQLLAFSRRQVLLPEIVRVDQVIRDFGSLLRRAVGDSVDLQVQSQAGLWLCEVDPAQFESAVLNLALNARDAMPRGGRLTLAAFNVESDAVGEVPSGDCVAVAVADTGTGMAPEVLAHAVEPFFTTKEVGKGSGLGLSQVYGFVEQSGGKLQIDSQPGGGTRVTMLFPARKAVLATREARAPDPSVVIGGLAILVVEDDADVRELVEQTLLAHGHTVVTANDGREALLILDDHPELQFVVSDVLMPNGTSGVALVQELRRRRPDIGVLLISGCPRDELSRLDGTSIYPFLPKPFHPAELAARISMLLSAAA